MTTGIILAAGQSRRFGLENGFGKCFTCVGDKMLVEYPIRTLKNLGIKSIVIGINPRDEFIARTFLEKYDGIEIKLSRSNGTAGCLKDVLTREINRGIVLYGDTVYFSSVGKFNDVLQKISIGYAVIGVKQTDSLENYMAIIERHGKYTAVLKPHGFKTGLAYIGLFGFNDPLILNKLSEIELSFRGELELTDLIKKYATLSTLELALSDYNLVDCNNREQILKILTLLK